MTRAIEIVDAGIATTIQDRGRPGLAHLGIPPGGAVDPALAGALNRLVGNPEHLAVLETCGGLVVRATTATLVACSAASAPVSLRAGQSYAVRPDGRRLWHYLAVRGGIDVAPVLGSRSLDTLSGIGPSAPTPGAALPIGPEPTRPVTADVVPLPTPRTVARVSAGPRADWFAPGWEDRLTAGEWRITATSRVGVRLAGVALERRVVTELASEGLLRGAIQVPPDGDPVMMLADHPTTGGYPVIAVVHPDDVSVVAQRPAGTTVRLSVDTPTARSAGRATPDDG